MRHTHQPTDVSIEIDAIMARSLLFAAIVGPLETPDSTSAYWRLPFKKQPSIPDELLNYTMDTIWALKAPDGTELFPVGNTVIDRLGSIELSASSDLNPHDVRHALAQAIDRPLMPALA